MKSGEASSLFDSLNGFQCTVHSLSRPSGSSNQVYSTLSVCLRRFPGPSRVITPGTEFSPHHTLCAGGGITPLRGSRSDSNRRTLVVMLVSKIKKFSSTFGFKHTLWRM